MIYKIALRTVQKFLNRTIFCRSSRKNVENLLFSFAPPLLYHFCPYLHYVSTHRKEINIGAHRVTEGLRKDRETRCEKSFVLDSTRIG
jgi:hypothetical protein